MMKNKRRLIIALIFIILVVTSLFVGVDQRVNIGSLIRFEGEAWQLFLLSRLPRTLVIIITATSISIAGMIMHALGRNKFISPSTAGTTDAAMLGILVGYILIPTQSNIVKFVFSFVFAMLATFIFVLIINRIKFKNTVYVPLIGMMFGGVIGSIATLIAQRFQILQVMSSIGVGSFAHISVINAQLLWMLVPALIFASVFVTKFNIIALGVDFAKNLGVNYGAVLILGLIIVSVISASTFIVVGPLPFLGLVVPNLMSIYYGDNMKKTFFDVALFGASFVLLNDIISRLLAFPGETPISFTMGISGAIIFFYLIFRKVRTKQ